MGGGRFDGGEYTRTFTPRTERAKTTGRAEEVYQSRSMETDFNPLNIEMRESRDSDDNPESNAIILGLDVTGSMGGVLIQIAASINTLITEIYNRKPVTDPHVMCMGIGDADANDSAPLQVTQFEADIRVAEQMTKIWFEKAGGGNGFESYTLPWLFANYKTSCDCWEKRQKKGYIFTMGDEQIQPKVTKGIASRIAGIDIQCDLKAEDLYALVSEKWDIFHLIIEQGCHGSETATLDSWQKVIGQRAILLGDYTKLAETVVSTIQLNEGMEIDEILESWSADIAKSVGLSLSGLNFRK